MINDFNQNAGNTSPTKSTQTKNLIKVKCCQEQPAVEFCINKKCKINEPFLCNDEDCECNQKHQNCPNLKINNMLKKIKAKLSEPGTFKDQLMEYFDKIID